MRSGETTVEPMNHDDVVRSVYICGDNQQIMSTGRRHKVYLWKILTGELLMPAAEGPESVRLLWKTRNEWNSGEKAVGESGKEILPITVAGQEVYICKATRNETLFKKFGQFDAAMDDWGVDASGALWVRLRDGKAARLEVVTKSSNAFGNRKDEVSLCALNGKLFQGQMKVQ